MSGTRILCSVLLVTLVVPLGVGPLDLCTCEGDRHGFFCGPEEAQELGSCCVERAQPEPGPSSSGDECPGCPTLDLGGDLVLISPAEDVAPSNDLVLLSSQDFPALVPNDRLDDRKHSGSRAPPQGRNRLHLLHCVFRL